MEEKGWRRKSCGKSSGHPILSLFRRRINGAFWFIKPNVCCILIVRVTACCAFHCANGLEFLFCCICVLPIPSSKRNENKWFMLKRICRLLLPDERKMGIRVVCAVFLCALLDFAGLAALLPVLFFLLDDGRDKDAALLFCLVAIVFILVKNALVAGLSRFQNHFLMSLYRRLSFLSLLLTINGDYCLYAAGGVSGWAMR